MIMTKKKTIYGYIAITNLYGIASRTANSQR